MNKTNQKKKKKKKKINKKKGKNNTVKYSPTPSAIHSVIIYIRLFVTVHLDYAV